VDADEIAAFFTDDAVYHNIPMDPIAGRDTIKTFIAGFAGGAEQIDFRVRNIVADGDVVLTERVDVFQLPNGKVELPVMGTFEVKDGKIAAWRDYFDMKQFMDQMAAG
jgi:limonene-1,2-epoxide hydrolase